MFCRPSKGSQKYWIESVDLLRHRAIIIESAVIALKWIYSKFI